MSAVATGPTTAIPEVRGLPLVGSLPDLTKDPAAFFVRCYHEHGPVFRLRVPGRTLSVLAGPELARYMGSREGQASLGMGTLYDGLTEELGATRSVIAMDGPEHKRLREVMRRGYSREGLKGRLGELIEITDRRLDAEWRPGTSVPAVSTLQLLVIDQLGTLLTGHAPLDYIDDIRTAVTTMLKVHLAKVRPTVMLKLPGYRRARDQLRQLGDGLLRDHRPPADGEAPRLVDDLVAAHEAHPELLSRRDLLMALTGPYVAGLDTVSNTLGSLLYLVLKHPDVLARVRAEADAVFSDPAFSAGGSDGGPGGLSLDDDVLDRLPSVQGAVQETMRLYPIAVSQPRVARQDFTYAGHLIRAGELVHCAVTVPHFLEEFFPDPMAVDIDRYDDQRREHARPGAYSPFGRGPHTCLGKGIADVQMTLTAARIFHRLELELPSPDYVLRRKAAPTPGPAASFAVRVVARRN